MKIATTFRLAGGEARTGVRLFRLPATAARKRAALAAGQPA